MSLLPTVATAFRSQPNCSISELVLTLPDFKLIGTSCNCSIEINSANYPVSFYQAMNQLQSRYLLLETVLLMNLRAKTANYMQVKNQKQDRSDPLT